MTVTSMTHNLAHTFEAVWHSKLVSGFSFTGTFIGATMTLCNTRLRKEFKDLQKNPVENIRAAPKEINILEWHYVIEGQKGSPFEGGFYHGTVVFPPEYPYKPPSIQMFTPNGRFKVRFEIWKANHPFIINFHFLKHFHYFDLHICYF